MASLSQNISYISGSAIYGPDVRSAIAEALDQVESESQSAISSAASSMNQALATSDQQVNRRLDELQTMIETEPFYMSLTSMGGEDYQLTIQNI